MSTRDNTTQNLLASAAAQERIKQIQSEMPTSLEEILAVVCPRGFPTFDQFRKNPDHYRLAKDHLFESIQGSTSIDRKFLAKQKIYWRYGTEPFTLGKLERVIKEHGYSIEDCDMLGYRVKNAMSGKDEVLVRVFPRSELQAMGAVVPNA